MTRAWTLQAAPLLVLVLCLAFAAPAAAAWSIRGQEAPAPVEVGAGPPGDRAFALVGRNVYQPDGVQLYGYLNAVLGLDPSLLFLEGIRSVTNARFTYRGDVPNAETAVHADVIAVNGIGAFRIYLDADGGAAWDDPASFAAGQVVAEFTLDLRDSVQRQAPGVGVAVGDARLTQDVAGEFSFNGETYRFGDAGIAQRMRAVGAVIGGEPAQPLMTGLSGSSSVVRRVTTAVALAGPGTPTPPLTTVSAACPALEPWLGQTLDGLAQAQALGAAVSAHGDLATLGAEAIGQAAADVGALAQTQRAAAAPTAGAAANQLAVTALSTYARGLQGIAGAAAVQNADMLAQGLSVLGDGEQLLGRAQDTVAQLGADCPES
jgi:hypothetical protein